MSPAHISLLRSRRTPCSLAGRCPTSVHDLTTPGRRTTRRRCAMRSLRRHGEARRRVGRSPSSPACVVRALRGSAAAKRPSRHADAARSPRGAFEERIARADSELCADLARHATATTSTAIASPSWSASAAASPAVSHTTMKAASARMAPTVTPTSSTTGRVRSWSRSGDLRRGAR